MLKSALVIINLFAILSIGYFNNDGVTVEQEFPSEIAAGESFTLNVTIKKGELEGFAKWQQKLPEGFIAEAKETKGATFSFKNQEVKLIWMAIPQEETFTISYDVLTDPLSKGDFEINGKFSFIENNERKDIVCPIKTISLKTSVEEGEDFPLVYKGEVDTSYKDTLRKMELEEQATTEANELAEMMEEKADEVEEQMLEDVSAELTEGVAQSSTKQGEIEVNRNIEHLGDGKYEVSLSINKGNLSDFGKVEEYLPPGYIASEIESNDGIFSFNKNVFKILWMRFPETNQLSVKYRMESQSDELDSAVVHGVLSYLDGVESVQMAISGTKFKNYKYEEEADDIVEEIAEKENPTEVTDTDETAENKVNSENEEIAEESSLEESPKETIVEEQADRNSNTEDLVAEITNVPSPEQEVKYKVQIAAGKKEVTRAYFKKVHKVTESVSTEYHNSWYKYTIGSYNIYKEARDKRNQVWEADNKINDAFVTAYNSGERISVQEALMITKQKWFK